MNRVTYRMFCFFSFISQIKKMDNTIKTQHFRNQILKFPLYNKKEKFCVGRESNPGQLLGRQLCSPLYHRRLNIGLALANNIDF